MIEAPLKIPKKLTNNQQQNGYGGENTRINNNLRNNYQNSDEIEFGSEFITKYNQYVNSQNMDEETKNQNDNQQVDDLKLELIKKKLIEMQNNTRFDTEESLIPTNIIINKF